MRAQRLHQPAQHERQRLQPVNRPLEIERLLEPLLRERRHQRMRILPACDPLPRHTGLAEPRRHLVTRQVREVPKRSQSPSAERQEIGRGQPGRGNRRQRVDRQRRQRGRLRARIDDGEPGLLVHEEPRRG